MQYGRGAYAIVRDSDAEVKKELARITNVSEGTPGYGNYRDWIANTKLEQQISLEDYSVSHRGLRAGLVGTPEQIAAQGGNKSLIHIDWMIGSDQTDIDGIRADGSRVPVFRKGEWA